MRWLDMDRSPREPHELAWQPLPRVHVDDLSYERFLREFALPKQPFILEGASAAWPATQRWQDLSYIAERAQLLLKVQSEEKLGGDPTKGRA